MLKPGYRTSEFWFTMVSFVFSGLYLLGLIGENSQKEDLIQETSRGVEAVILIIGQLTVLFRYIKGRTDLKKTWWSTATPEERDTASKKYNKTKIVPEEQKPTKTKVKPKSKTTTKKKPNKNDKSNSVGK